MEVGNHDLNVMMIVIMCNSLKQHIILKYLKVIVVRKANKLYKYNSNKNRVQLIEYNKYIYSE